MRARCGFDAKPRIGAADRDGRGEIGFGVRYPRQPCDVVERKARFSKQMFQ